MEHAITIALIIMVICLTIIVYLQIEIINYNDDLESEIDRRLGIQRRLDREVFNRKFPSKTTK